MRTGLAAGFSGVGVNSHRTVLRPRSAGLAASAPALLAESAVAAELTEVGPTLVGAAVAMVVVRVAATRPVAATRRGSLRNMTTR